MNDTAEEILEAMGKVIQEIVEGDRLYTDTDLDDAAKDLRAAIERAVGGIEADTHKDYGTEYYDWVLDRYESIKTPHPLDFEDTARALRTVAIAMTGESEKDEALNFGDPDFLDINAAATHFSDWDGTFADKVKDDYLTPFPGVMVNHGKVAAHLLDRITRMAHIYSRRRNEAHKIARQGVTAIEKWEESSGDLALFFAVLISIGTAATAVGGFVAGPLAVAAIGAGSGAIISGTLGSALAPEEEEVPLGSNILWDIIDNIKNAIDKNDEQMHQDEEELTDTLKTESEVLWGYWMREPGPEHPLMPLVPKWHDPDHGGGDPGTIKDGDLVINPGG